MLGSLPFLVLGSLLVPLSLVARPMIPLISNDQQSIRRSDVAGYYYYAEWRLELSAYQRAEFQFSSSQPVDFYIFDKENFDRYLNNQTNTLITSSLSELENTHSFTPTEADTYVFMLLNIAGQDATVNVTIRRSFTGLEYIGASILIFGGIVTAVGVLLRPKAVEIPTLVLEMLKMHGRIKVSELAAIFSTSQADIEMALLKLRIQGEPIVFEPVTGEVSYGSEPRTRDTPLSPPPSSGTASQP